MSASPLIFVLGGTRSGKSAEAEKRALALAGRHGGEKPFYLATGDAFDDEMAARIARHKAMRGDAFITIEAPLDLAGAISALPSSRQTVLIDGMGIWLTNCTFRRGEWWQEPLDALMEALEAGQHRAILVSDEVGGGITPDNLMARQFCDALGLMNQYLAHRADEVIFVTAGIATRLKPERS